MSTIRYSFANAKQLHIDLYKQLIVDALAADEALSVDEACEFALSAADASVALLEKRGRIARADGSL